MYLASSVVWAFWLFTFLGGTVSWLHVPPTVQVLNAVVFLGANGAMIAMHAVAGRNRHPRLARYALLLPAYWVLHSVAAWRAVWHLLVKPDVWEKTPHGLAAAARASGGVPASVGSSPAYARRSEILGAS